ncbi:MAG: hypothetical protein RIC89_22475, partial [Pseudomonadales bacterium]
HDIGSISEGKRADMILFNSDPTVSVENLSDRAGVVVQGAYYTDDVLRERLVSNRQEAMNYMQRLSPEQ